MPYAIKGRFKFDNVECLIIGRKHKDENRLFVIEPEDNFICTYDKKEIWVSDKEIETLGVFDKIQI